MKMLAQEIAKMPIPKTNNGLTDGLAFAGEDVMGSVYR